MYELSFSLPCEAIALPLVSGKSKIDSADQFFGPRDETSEVICAPSAAWPRQPSLFVDALATLPLPRLRIHLASSQRTCRDIGTSFRFNDATYLVMFPGVNLLILPVIQKLYECPLTPKQQDSSIVQIASIRKVKRMRGLLFSLMAAGIVSGCSRQQTVRSDELARSRRDVSQLLGSGNVNDPDSIKENVKTSSRIGEKLKEVVLKRKQIAEEQRRRIAKLNLRRILSPERLSSMAGITQSRSDIGKLRSSDNLYFGDLKRLSRGLIDWSKKEFNHEPHIAVQNLAMLEELRLRSMETYDGMGAVLDYAEMHKPKVSQDGRLVFAQTAESAAYTDLVRRVQASSTKYRLRQAFAEERTRRQTAEAIKEFQGG
jgi:hypothetical protein